MFSKCWRIRHFFLLYKPSTNWAWNNKEGTTKTNECCHNLNRDATVLSTIYRNESQQNDMYIIAHCFHSYAYSTNFSHRAQLIFVKTVKKTSNYKKRITNATRSWSAAEIRIWIQTHARLTDRTTRVRRHQKGQTNPDFNEARGDGVTVASAGPYASHLHLAPDR